MVRVLMVDDDEDDREIFVSALKSLNIQVQCHIARDGREAIEMLQSEILLAPDFIFLDLNMPRLSGMECLKELQSIPGLKSIPVIIYTTSRNETDIEKSLASGAAGFISKPTKFEELQRILGTILRSSGTFSKKKIVFT